MSGEKIGSLTNNGGGGWGSRMQTESTEQSIPASSFPGGGGGKERLGPSPGAVGAGWLGPGRGTEGQSGLSGRGSLQGRQRDTVAPAVCTTVISSSLPDDAGARYVGKDRCGAWQ